MKKKENHFLKILIIESIFFLAFACAGIYFIPFLEAKEREGGWQKEENSTWQNYFTALTVLENMMEINEEESKMDNVLGNFLTDYVKTVESDKGYIEIVKLKEINHKEQRILEQKLGTSYIKIKKKENHEVQGLLHHDYIQKKVSVVIYGNSWGKLEKSDMTVVWKKNSYAIDTIENIPIFLNTYQYQKNTEQEEIKEFTGKSIKQEEILLEFDADRIFSYNLYQDENYVYITFCNPKDVFDKIVVVDAGHGGADTGTYAKSGDWNEKDFNLDFVRKMEECWNHNNIKLYFTRLEDTKVTLVERVNFVNDLQADLFVSLHCNSSDENSGSGLEVLYKSNEYVEESKNFAKKCLKALEGVTGLTNRGLLKGKRIYIIRNANMPTILLELGFLSDSRDLAYLSNEENRKKMAETICQMIWENLRRID